jgi:hypothetical protein
VGDSDFFTNVLERRLSVFSERRGAVAFESIHAPRQSTVSCWSRAVAIFGAMCNLLCLIFDNYQSYYLQRFPVIWDFSSIFLEIISLTPLLAPFVLRRFTSVVFIYAIILFLILTWRVCHLVGYYTYGVSALSYKIEMARLLLAFLGFISAVVVLISVVIRGAVLIQRKCGGSASRLCSVCFERLS